MVTDGDVSGCFHRWDLSRFGVSCFGPNSGSLWRAQDAVCRCAGDRRGCNVVVPDPVVVDVCVAVLHRSHGLCWAF